MKVLVVEDEPRLAVSLRKGLLAEGYGVEIAADGEQGLWLAQSVSFDAIVLDIMLPKLNGFQVCAALRNANIWTPILMLTAKDGDNDIAEALDTGADDYLTKPFSMVVLTARLRALTRRGATERPTELGIDDLTVDPARRRCRRAGTDIALSPKEYTVLEYLMRRAGEVVSKAEILEHGWDFAYDGDPNIVEVYVSNLRRKIDAPFGTSNLRTVWGVGYEIVADDEGGASAPIRLAGWKKHPGGSRSEAELGPISNDASAEKKSDATSSQPTAAKRGGAKKNAPM
jgi:DNA-binding response OmpR family regulator